jgi:hypothetical protein
MHRGIKMQRLVLSVMVLAAALAVAPDFARVQEGPGGLINPGRDCQTIRTCNFSRSGSYRGCLSSYSCRVCRFVRVSCKGLRGGTCQKLRCGWGGVS